MKKLMKRGVKSVINDSSARPLFMMAREDVVNCWCIKCKCTHVADISNQLTIQKITKPLFP